MVSAQEALERLKEGNRRFVNNLRSAEAMMSQLRRGELVKGQNPFAIVLGCSDSRVPAEIVFDQGLGDLFVIRVAGNIVAPSQIGSVEFAAEAFGTRLVVVLGHTFCGAINATLDVIENPHAQRSPNLLSIVERVRPAIESLVHTDLAKDRPRLVYEAVRANVRASVSHLKHGSRMLEQMVLEDGMRVVGAEYSLESGEVDFFQPWVRNITYGGGRGQNISSLQPKTLYTLRARGRVGTHGEVLEVLVKGNNYKYTLTFNTTSFQEKVVTFLTPADITWMQINISKGPGSLGYLDEISLVK